MVALRFTPFGGMVPLVDGTLLPDNAATLSRDTYLYDGTLRGLPEPKLIHTCADSKATRAFRIPNNYVDNIHLNDAVWLEFQNPNTDVIRSLVVGDTFDRYYWASSAGAPKYNTLARIKNGDDPFLLGIPSPTVAPTVSVSGGSSDVTQSRAYVYTWVSAYGEEGPPSIPSTVTTGKQDDTWSLTLSAPATGDTGTDRNLTKTRIYRTVTASDGNATYFFVDEIDIDTLTYDDTKSDTEVSANSELESTTWSAPPTDLQGFAIMPNGIVAGWRKNEVWFCEPYRLHAWPAQYALTVESPIVGLGVHGETLVVLTETSPYLMYGPDPASISQQKIHTTEPCMSRGSIVSSPEGVYYASPNGLILVAYGVATNVTKDMLSKEAWQKYVPSPTLNAGRLQTGFYCFGSARLGVFNTNAFNTDAFAQEDFTGAYMGALMDADKRVGFSVLSTEDPMYNVFNDVWTGELFVMKLGKVFWIDTSDKDPTQVPYLWRSKLFQATDSKSFAAMKVYFEVTDKAPTQNATRNTSSPQTLGDNQYGLVRVYADGKLVTTREIWKSGELMRIPSGFKAEFWQLEVEARVKIRNIQIATSAKELSSV